MAGFVVNDSGEVLVVRERHYNSIWKLPGGLADPGEDFGVTACREVEEETGVPTAFHSLVGLRHQHEMAFGRSDIYVICRLEPSGALDASPQEGEIEAVCWMPIQEFIDICNHPMCASLDLVQTRRLLGFWSYWGRLSI